MPGRGRLTRSGSEAALRAGKLPGTACSAGGGGWETSITFALRDPGSKGLTAFQAVKYHMKDGGAERCRGRGKKTSLGVRNPPRLCGLRQLLFLRLGSLTGKTEVKIPALLSYLVGCHENALRE